MGTLDGVQVGDYLKTDLGWGHSREVAAKVVGLTKTRALLGGHGKRQVRLKDGYQIGTNEGRFHRLYWTKATEEDLIRIRRDRLQARIASRLSSVKWSEKSLDELVQIARVVFGENDEQARPETSGA